MKSRRTGWVVLAAVAVAVLVGGLVRRRRRRPGPPVPEVRSAVMLPAAPRSPSGPARSLVRLAFGAGFVVVLAVVAVVVTRPSDYRGPDAHASSWGRTEPMSLAECQAAVAEHGVTTCGGFETAGLDRIYDEPSADPSDPRYAGAALPTGLNTDGRVCVAGSERPVLDTVRPVLSASFTAVPGLTRVGSTFQITGVYGRTAEDAQLPGDPGDAMSATLDFARQEKLKHDQSYRWRVRGTPLGVGGGGWSPWCEFTIPRTTPDDLGLDRFRTYRVTLTASQWRDVIRITGARIEAALKTAKSPADPVAVNLNGRDWSGLVDHLASTASQNGDPAVWRLADQISSALGGPDRPTLGFPR